MGTEPLTAIGAVRKRPGMYVGDTNGSGVLHMLLEVLANAYDQHLAGRCSKVEIDVASDGTVTVEDDGPGLAADGGNGVPPVQELLTRMSNRPTVDGHRPHVHLGLGGMGLFVVNALSERFELRSVRDRLAVAAEYARGEVVAPPVTCATNAAPGTRVRFRPDPEIFKYPRIPRAELAARLEDLSFLVPKLALSWRIAGDDLAPGGLAARVALGVPCDAQDVATHRAAYTTAKGAIDVGVALAWHTSRWGANQAPSIDSFVNLARTPGHGTHIDGLLDGIRSFFGAAAEDRVPGLVAAVAVVLADVHYGSPEKNRLEASEARAPVADATKSALSNWSSRRPDLFAEIRARIARE